MTDAASHPDKRQKPKKAKLAAAERITRIEQKRAAEQARVEEDQRRRLSALGAETDKRTASGCRTARMRIVEAKDGRFVMIDHIAACLPTKADRTPARVLAWPKLEAHFQKADAGGMGAMKMGVRVDGGNINQDLMRASLIDAIDDDRLLRRGSVGKPGVGDHGHAILHAVIHLGKTLQEAGTTKRQFKLALDRAAVFFDLHDSSMGEEASAVVERAIEASVRLANSSQPFDRKRARLARESGLTIREVQDMFVGASYRDVYLAVADIKPNGETPTLKAWQARKKRTTAGLQLGTRRDR